MIDVNTYIGGYPYRHVPHPDPEVLVRVLDREGVEAAWTAHLPSAFYRDPEPGNDALVDALARFRDRLHPVPTIRPDWPGWQAALSRARDTGAPGVRIYPQLIGLGAGHPALTDLAAACAASALAVVLTVRFEDSRQRHPLDTAPELPAATIRLLARAGTGARIVVLGAGRSFVEEVHWSLTQQERQLLFWDISWIWGPPEDDLALLLRVIGADRFVYGSGWPLRLAQSPRANLALLPDELQGVGLGAL